MAKKEVNINDLENIVGGKLTKSYHYVCPHCHKELPLSSLQGTSGSYTCPDCGTLVEKRYY